MSAWTASVLSAMVLPPAFGPVMTSNGRSGPSSRSIGTTVRLGSLQLWASRSGWRAPRSATVRAVSITGAVARMRSAACARAKVEPCPYAGGQLGKDTRGLVLLLAGRLDEVVVRVEDVLGLDGERLAALRAVVDDAAHAAPRLGPHRQHVPTMPERDVPVGEEPVGVAPLEGALELGGELSATLADLAPEALERRARIVGDGAARVEGAAQPVRELGEAGQGLGDRRHAGARLTHGSTVGAELRARLENGNDQDQLGTVENAAVGTAADQHGTNIGESFERERPGGRERQSGLARHVDRRFDLRHVGEGLRRRRALATHLGRRFVSQERPHRIPFGAGLPDSACLQPSPHWLPTRITGVPGVHRGMLRLIGYPFAPLGLLAGGEGFALAPNAGLFVVLTLLEF